MGESCVAIEILAQFVLSGIFAIARQFERTWTSRTAIAKNPAAVTAVGVTAAAVTAAAAAAAIAFATTPAGEEASMHACGDTRKAGSHGVRWQRTFVSERGQRY